MYILHFFHWYDLTVSVFVLINWNLIWLCVCVVVYGCMFVFDFTSNVSFSLTPIQPNSVGTALNDTKGPATNHQRKPKEKRKKEKINNNEKKLKPITSKSSLVYGCCCDTIPSSYACVYIYICVCNIANEQIRYTLSFDLFYARTSRAAI